jgi:hypothetical protein
MQVQGANPQSSKLQGAQCEPNMSLSIEIAYLLLWLDRNFKYQSLGKISQRQRILVHNFNAWKMSACNRLMIAYRFHIAKGPRRTHYHLIGWWVILPSSSFLSFFWVEETRSIVVE